MGTGFLLEVIRGDTNALKWIVVMVAEYIKNH